MTTSPPAMTPAQLDAFGRELDAIRERVIADLGERDAAYIRTIIKAQRALEVGGRGLLFFSALPPAWIAGTAALSISKILDNMEIGHNVMHGQYDWMNDPAVNGQRFEWDSACPSEQWRHSHNYMHHTHTNILGKDRDIGYGVLRMSEDQRWHPYYLGNPLYAAVLAAFFQWGVAFHDLEVDRIAAGKTTWKDKLDMVGAIWRKGRRQALKDYLFFPALAGPNAPTTLTANVTANFVRNVWAFMIIFCGHFPDGVEEFTLEETEGETRGEWYRRQLLGSANLTGGPLFHVMSGNLSHQIEHHLFPDLPAHRYGELAVEVREICERYGLPYNSGPLHKQFGSVVRKIVRLALPDRGSEHAPEPARAREHAEGGTAARELVTA